MTAADLANAVRPISYEIEKASGSVEKAAGSIDKAAGSIDRAAGSIAKTASSITSSFERTMTKKLRIRLINFDCQFGIEKDFNLDFNLLEEKIWKWL